jgi:tetratricopeptide (TPR) repeat protein
MHGEEVKKKAKSKWDLVIEDEIRAYIDSLHLEIQVGAEKLRSPAMERARLVQEMKEALTYNKLAMLIKEALDFLQTSASQYLEKDAREELKSNLDAIPEIIDQSTIESLENKNFQEVLKISDMNMGSIYKIAVAKFDEQQYDVCLALFALLSTLNPLNEGIWFRLGIAAQKKEDYDLALNCYKTATELNPQLVEPSLFSVECYLRKELVPEAKAVFEILKAKAKDVEAAPVWKEPISQIEDILANLQ